MSTTEIDDLARVLHRELNTSSYAASWESANPTTRQQFRKAAKAVLERMEVAA